MADRVVVWVQGFKMPVKVKIDRWGCCVSCIYWRFRHSVTFFTRESWLREKAGFDNLWKMWSLELLTWAHSCLWMCFFSGAISHLISESSLSPSWSWRRVDWLVSECFRFHIIWIYLFDFTFATVTLWPAFVQECPSIWANSTKTKCEFQKVFKVFFDSIWSSIVS